MNPLPHQAREELHRRKALENAAKLPPRAFWLSVVSLAISLSTLAIVAYDHLK